MLDDSGALRISNDLYGNDVISARELAKCYTRPMYSGMPPFEIPTEIVNAHNTLLGKRKLTLILRSKSVQDVSVSGGDLVEIYLKQQNFQRGKWKPVVSYDRK